MVNNEALMHDLILLSRNFYKIIEVNLNEDTYFEVKIDDNEPHIYNGLKKWVDAFSEKGVYEEDKERFIKFFDPLLLKAGINKWQKCYYRRMINNEWRYVCMEVIPFDNYTEDDALVLIVVRDVEDYVKQFREQIKNEATN